MAFSNTIKYYITGTTTPSSSSENGSTAEKSASNEPSSCGADVHPSHKPHKADSKIKKRPAELQAHGNVKHFKPTPKTSRGTSSDVDEEAPVGLFQSIDIVSDASDNELTASAVSTTALDKDLLHNAITRMLPQVQPGLFPTEICDRLSKKHPDLIWEKYKSYDSFKAMILQTLTAMLKEKKVDRRDKETQNKGRSHQYVTLVQSEPVRSHPTMDAETPSLTVDGTDSHSRAPSASPNAAPQREVQIQGSGQVSPAIVQSTKNLHTAASVAATAISRNEKTLSPGEGEGSKSASKIPEAPRTSATEQRSTHVISEASKTEARGSSQKREECTQPRVLEPASILPQMPSSRLSAETLGVPRLTETSGHNSERPSLASPTGQDDHLVPSASNVQGVQQKQALKVDVQRTVPAKSPPPLLSCTKHTAPKPASSNNLSTEPIPGSCLFRRPETEAPVSRPSQPFGSKDQLSSCEKASHKQDPISDIINGGGETKKTSLPTKSSSGDVPPPSQTPDAASCAQKPQTVVAHVQMNRGSPAQSQKQATATADIQNSPSLAGSSACSGRSTIAENQSKPSFTAINPRKQPEVREPTLSAGMQTTALTASALLRETTLKSTPKRDSKAEPHGPNALEKLQHQSRPDVSGISNSNMHMSRQQSHASSFPLPQHASQGFSAKGTHSKMAAKQAKQSQDLAIPVQVQQSPQNALLGNRGSANPTGQVQQIVTVDLTNISQADERASQTTHMQANHRDRDALDLGNLVDSAREAADMRRKYGVEAKFFNTKRQNAESSLDELHKSMDANMRTLSKRNEKIEELRKQFAEQESKVESEMKNIREQADRTRDMADKVILEWRNYEKLEEKAEREFANADREWKRCVQALGIL